MEATIVQPAILAEPTVEIKRTMLKRSPFIGGRFRPLQPGLWPARWISHRESSSERLPVVVAYRLELSLFEPLKVLLHLTADERYEFFINGKLVARGPERGDVECWPFESYSAHFEAGVHQLVAKVYSLGEKAAQAQLYLKHGFFLCPEEDEMQEILATGSAAWQCKLVEGISWRSPAAAWGTGWKQVLRADRFPWGVEHGEGDGWEPPVVGAYGDSAEGLRSCSYHANTALLHRLHPAQLPPMMDRPFRGGTVRYVSTFQSRPVGLEPIQKACHLADEAQCWQMLLNQENEEGVEIPPYVRRRVVIDLENYFCVRPELTFSKGAGSQIDIGLSEAAYADFEDPAALLRRVWSKGNRNKLDGKHLVSPWQADEIPGDGIYADGSLNRTFVPYWWHSGRYVQLLIETKGESLWIDRLQWRETRYPLEMESCIDVSDPTISALVPLMLRGLQACAHETYMDCPYYEQLMYIGDTRLQLLCSYVLTSDERLARKSLEMFCKAQLSSGFIPSRYPCRVRQMIPPFSFWWVAMCYDYALWRGNGDFVKRMLPGVRATCDAFSECITADGLLRSHEGWNFTDWAGEQWPMGVPPGGGDGYSGVLNWQAAWIYRLAAELEEAFGESEIAMLQHRRSKIIAQAAHRTFWNEERGLYADDIGHSFWSEHTQCMAILSGLMPEGLKYRVAANLVTDAGLTRASIYFTHYLFEAFCDVGRSDLILTRLDLWKELLVNGLKTPIESPEPTRSDCHAWGSHPLYHLYATIAGIRPASMGFKSLRIAPELGDLAFIRGSMPHPSGIIHFDFNKDSISFSLPPGVSQAMD